MVDDERLTWADAPAYMALHLAKHLPVEDIARLSCVCRAWRDSLAQGYVWKQLLERDFRGLGVVDGSEADFESQGKPGRLHHGPHGPEWRALYRDMRSGAHQETLALKQVACSSIDFPEESARNTLWPSHCFHERHKRRKSYECSCVRGGACYWSSAPSSDSASKEHLVYELVCPCVVTKISICSYHAWWQPPIPPTEEEPGGEPPTYPPERVRVSTAWGIHESDVELVLGEREWPTGLSARDPVELELDRPVACFGGFLRVDLIGKRQRQTVTDLDFYYTCINFVSVQGRVMKEHVYRRPEWREPVLYGPSDGACRVCFALGSQVRCRKCGAAVYCSEDHRASGEKVHDILICENNVDHTANIAVLQAWFSSEVSALAPM